MEEVQARHRKEQRELVARITQKKKSATKKTRKGVNDECAALESELKERQQREIAALNGEPSAEESPRDDLVPAEESHTESTNGGIADAVKDLSLDAKQSTNGEAPDETNTPAPKKRNKARERLARRAAEREALAAEAAEEAANMPDLRKQEKEKMTEEFRNRGLQEKIIRADGHCLYSAVADQLDAYEIDLKPKIPLSTVQVSDNDFAELPPYKKVRSAAAAYIQTNSDDFLPFLEEPLASYVHKVKDTGEWGGQMELMALAKTYNVPIHVIQGSGRVEKIEGGEGADDNKSIWLAYYRHGFGLGEHYNSLRKVP